MTNPRVHAASFRTPRVCPSVRLGQAGCGSSSLRSRRPWCVYMAIMSLDPTGRGQARWTMRWKTALNAFDITFDGRLSAARQ